MSSSENSDPVAAPEQAGTDAPRARRETGARQPVSEAVVFRALSTGDGAAKKLDLQGWSLNISRGGLRAILEEGELMVGEEYEVVVGEDDEGRTGHVVWVRQEKGGAIVGVAFADAGSAPPPPPPSSRPPAPTGETAEALFPSEQPPTESEPPGPGDPPPDEAASSTD